MLGRIALLGILISFVAFPSISEGRTEKNSFLNRHARTRAALVAQVKKDAAVRDRYMRHFAMTADEVVRYFESLTLTKLEKPGTFEVYNVPDSGVLRSRTFNLPKGTSVWVDRFGRPILKASCGNPMTLGPKEVATVPAILLEVEIPEDLKALETPEVLAETDLELLVINQTPETPELVVLTPPVIEEPLGPVTGGEEPREFLPPVAAGPGPGLLAIPLIGGLGALLGGGGGSPPPVPEPASLLAVTFGAGGLWLRSRARSRREKAGR